MPTFAYCGPAPGQPIEEQLGAIRRYSDRVGVEPPETFLDGKDGCKLPWLERVGAKALLARVGSGDRILLATAAAVYTRARDMIAVADLLERESVTLVMLRENYILVPGSTHLKAFRAAMHAMSELSRSLRSETIRLGLKARREAGGRYCNYPGYGRKWSGRRGHEVLVDDPDEQYVIGKIRQWWADGHGAEAIFHHLRSHGIQTREGRFWSRDRIRRVARAPLHLTAGTQARPEPG